MILVLLGLCIYLAVDFNDLGVMDWIILSLAGLTVLIHLARIIMILSMKRDEKK
ncbi:hypothetical protein [Halalkalibacterium halodurans]|uniref:hypothetical protein n=1 Tax=Halalkalibacterium halodurans TaxID=86665 RepID=UPI00158651E9|nr:hypothetical protein [Halalkalibacterium halodurans]